MRKILWRVIAVVVLVTFAPGYVSGQNFFLGGQLGISIQKPSIEEIEFSTDTTYLYGVFAGIKFSSLALEFHYFQAAHDLEIEELIDPWADREIDYNYVGLNLKVFLPIPLLNPYLTGGYGTYRAEISGIDKDANEGFNIGAGIELRLGDHFALRGEGKYHRVKLNIDDRDLKLGDFTAAVGITFYLF
jgi:opacity protein-like surface antigen